MTRSKLGPIADDDFQSDVTHMPNIDKEYTKPFLDRMERLKARVTRTRDAAAKKKVAPGQKQKE